MVMALAERSIMICDTVRVRVEIWNPIIPNYPTRAHWLCLAPDATVSDAIARAHPMLLVDEYNITPAAVGDMLVGELEPVAGIVVCPVIKLLTSIKGGRPNPFPFARLQKTQRPPPRTHIHTRGWPVVRREAFEAVIDDGEDRRPRLEAVVVPTLTTRPRWLDKEEERPQADDAGDTQLADDAVASKQPAEMVDKRAKFSADD
jgi:hypothetical protein